MNRVFPTFSRTCLFLLLTLSLLCSSHFFSSPLWLFPPLLFYVSILSEVWLLNFLRWVIIMIHRYCVSRILYLSSPLWLVFLALQSAIISIRLLSSHLVNIYIYTPKTSTSAALGRSFTLFQHLNFQEWSVHVLLCTFWLGNVLRATTACTFSTSQLPKVVRSWRVLYILTWKCASRHNGVHFFDISTSKSDPKLACFVHFDLEMCFAPQRRAFFYFSSNQMAPHPPL